MNKLSDRVSVVQKDIALLERGKEVRYLGINLAIGDIFDAGSSSIVLTVRSWTFACCAMSNACCFMALKPMHDKGTIVHVLIGSMHQAAEGPGQQNVGCVQAC